MSALIRCLPLALALACAPRSVDRAIVDEDAGAPSASRPGPAAGPSPPIDPVAPIPVDSPAERDAAVRTDAVRTDAAGRDSLPPAPDAAADRFDEVLRTADAAADRFFTAEDAGDGPAPRTALLVVGSATALTAGDVRIGQVMRAVGLSVRLASDIDTVDVTGVRLVVLAASCLSTNIGTRYRDLAIPLLTTEPAVLDDLGMTGPTEGVDWEETPGDQVNIVLPTHQMAAGMTGAILVVDQLATLSWGRPAPTAEQVATFQGQADRAAIFGYPRLAVMVTGRAPARRVGFFAADLAAARLTSNGIRLLAAAMSWALR